MTKEASTDKPRPNEPSDADAAAAEPEPQPESHGHGHKHGKHAKIDASEAEKYYDQLLRARAEFDNYRKRIAQEKQYADLAANEKLFLKLIGVLDTFELALASAEKAEGSEAVVDGIKLVQNQLQNVLKESGLEEIDALNAKFDPNFHEAIQQMESADHEDGTVIQQVRKGYKFKDRLLRPASVVVSKTPEKTQ